MNQCRVSFQESLVVMSSNVSWSFRSFSFPSSSVFCLLSGLHKAKSVLSPHVLIQPPGAVGSMTDATVLLYLLCVRISPPCFCLGEHFRKQKMTKALPWAALFHSLLIGCPLTQQLYTKHGHSYTHYLEDAVCKQGYLSILGWRLLLKPL